MRHISLIILIFLTTRESFAETHSDPASLSWMETLNAQTPELIEEYKAEVAAITDNAHQAVSHNQCPVTGLCKSAGSFEALLKTHASAPEQTSLKQIPQLLVFVSFSMSKANLKTLAQSLKRIGGSLVFRGLVNDGFKDTGKAFQELGEEALIDPLLFRTYGVTAVPAFILRQAGDNSQASMSETPIIFDQISGNVTLDYALSRFADKGEVKGAHELLAQLRGQN